MKWILPFVLCYLSLCSFAQEDGCSFEVSPKIQKALDQSRDTKKYEAAERLEILEKAIEEEPGCLPCLQRIGEMEFLLAKRSGASFASAEQHLEKLVELCPEYHSEPYYLLGAMFYADQQFEKAITYFEKFMRFPDSDPSKFEKDYDKKYAEVEEALVTVRELNEVFNAGVEFNPRKVSGVSSDVDEYLPMISADGEIMFYTRKLYKQAKGDFEVRMIEEFTWSKRSDINAAFNSGEPLPDPFNFGDNYGGATVSVDNRELIIAKKNPVPKNPQNVDLFTTRYERVTDAAGQLVYRWGPLEPLGDNINTVDGWEAQPSLSGDGNTLFFVGVRPECMKDEAGNPTHDLFISERQSDGSWGPCRPLDATINTPKHEKAPYMHSDSKTLYFSSNGRPGAGGMDFYYCQMNEDHTFTKPKNMGVPINDENDQVGIIVSSDGEVAYFGANKYLGGKGYDIFEFKMPEKARPEKVMIVKGEVKNEEGQPAADASVAITYREEGKTEQVRVNADDGSYAAVVRMSSKQDVSLQVKGEGVAFNSRVIARKEDPDTPVVVKLDMETATVAEDKSFIINDINYETASATITEDSRIILDEFAAYLLEHPTMEIEIGGHTDNIGNDQANAALSAERAFEVLNYLVSKGVDGKRMTYKGYGESRPIGDNTTEEGRARNRRTEFRVRKV